MVNVSIGDVAQRMTVTIRVTGMRWYSARCVVGVALLKLAAMVLPMKSKVEVSK